MPDSINFTKRIIDAIPVPQTRIEYADNKIPELRLRITPANTKSFCVYKRIPGSKPVRITLGKYPNLAPERARALAMRQLATISEGVNPNERKRVLAQTDITLKQAYDIYLSNKDLKDKTRYGYDSVFKCHLSSIVDKPLKLINREVVARLHREISSKAQADLTMRILRAVFNFAKGEFLREDGSSLHPDNPVGVLSHRKQWHNVGRKQTHLRPADLPVFFQALKDVKSAETLTGQSICDAMHFALLTGLRRSEIFALQWEDINFKAKVFTIYETKNSHDLELPLTPFISQIFEEAQKRQLSQYVFGGENIYGQVREPKKVVEKVRKLSGTECHFHDLRRTFATTAEHLDVGTYKLKRMMNHTTGRSDVTAGYTILTAETLRGSAIKVQNFLNEQIGESSGL